MIIYLATRRERAVIAGFLGSFGRQLLDRLTVRSYDWLLRQRSLSPATYIFSDIERLDVDTRERCANAWRQLDRTGNCRLLNHPLESKGRYPLLRRLHADGHNDFNVYRHGDGAAPQRYPVFVRRENGHGGAESGLLHNPQQLAAALDQLATRIDPGDLLVTEFCARPDSLGRYHKYSSFIIGGRIVPGHLFVSDDWCVKYPQLVDDDIVETEHRFIEDNAHAGQLLEICHDAGIDYGRVDFGLVDGRPQVYEINTNPLVMGETDNHGTRRADARALSARLINQAFEAIDTVQEGARVSIEPLPRRHPWEDRGLAYSLSSLLATLLLVPRQAPRIYVRLVHLAEGMVKRKWLPRSGR